VSVTEIKIEPVDIRFAEILPAQVGDEINRRDARITYDAAGVGRANST